MSDHINPSHYKTPSGIEAIDVMEHFGLGLQLGSAMKYLLRAGRKDPSRTVEDLEKAQWYVRRWLSGMDDGSDAIDVPRASNAPGRGLNWHRPEEIADAFGLEGYRREAVLDLLEAAAFGDPHLRVMEAAAQLDNAVKVAKWAALPKHHAVSA